VLSGTVRVAADGRDDDTAGSGDILGMYETLGGRPMRSTGTVVEAGTAMRIDRSELFELLADDVPLLQGIFSGLLQGSGRKAAERHEHAAAH
jgi:CRP-like cAMP-binding protein